MITHVLELMKKHMKKQLEYEMDMGQCRDHHCAYHLLTPCYKRLHGASGLIVWESWFWSILRSCRLLVSTVFPKFEALRS